LICRAPPRYCQPPMTKRILVAQSNLTGLRSRKHIQPFELLHPIEGAAAQALGQVLFEELRYLGDAPENATPLTYRVARAADMPVRFEGFVVEHGLGIGPGGLKGSARPACSASPPRWPMRSRTRAAPA
jgi:hypothetical protein